MGMLRQLHRKEKAERAKTKAYNLSRDIQQFYSTHMVAPFQRKYVSDIRKMYEEKQKSLDIAHDHASSRLSEEYMQYELDYLMASDEFKTNNPGMEPHEKGLKGIFSQAFWKNLSVRAQRLGLNYGIKES